MTATADHRPILVTGAHRSGTTWTAAMLELSRAVHVVHEPLNPRWGEWLTRPVPHWFEYVTEDDEWRDQFEAVMSLRYPLVGRLRRSHDLRGVRHALMLATKAARARRRDLVPLIKDPLAVFSAPWLARTFGVRPVILVRRPEAFVGSLKRMAWRFDAANLLNQPALVTGPLAPVADELRRRAVLAADVVDEGIVVWTAVYTAVDRYRVDHPEWVFLRHEDLSLDPVARFEEIYDRLQLPWTPSVAAAVAAYSASDNPPDAPTGEPHLLRRDSRASLTTWHERLDADEVARVRQATAELAARFYGTDAGTSSGS